MTGLYCTIYSTEDSELFISVWFTNTSVTSGYHLCVRTGSRERNELEWVCPMDTEILQNYEPCYYGSKSVNHGPNVSATAHVWTPGTIMTSRTIPQTPLGRAIGITLDNENGRLRTSLPARVILEPPPSPPSRRARTSHRQRLSPWLVKVARALVVMVTGPVICIFVPEADGLNVLISAFGVNWYFFRWSTFVFNTLEVSQEEVPLSMMWKVVTATYVSINRVESTDRKIRRLSLDETPVSADGWVSAAFECRSSPPYFWPIVRIHLHMCVVCCVFWNLHVPVTVPGRCAKIRYLSVV